MRRAFVQSKAGMPATASAYSALEGLRLLGFDVDLFEACDLGTLSRQRADVVVGFVSVVHEALRGLAIEPPDLDPAPRSLLPFFGREVVTTTMGEVRRRDDVVFVKPRHEHKLFAGHVRDGNVAALAQTASVPDACVVLVSPVIDLVAEWRCFVLRGACVGARPYRGPFDAVPDLARARGLVRAYAEAPAAYALDLGLTSSGETIVVEVNDAIGLQSYGLPPVAYAELLVARWDEVTAS